MRALSRPVPVHDGVGQGYRLIRYVAKMEKLVYRHNRITRSTHWVNALALVILVMSGFQIFNAHPHLYWGSTSEPDQAFLSIAAANDDGEVRGFFRIYGWQFDTTGVLGVQNTAMGPAPRAFPSWLTIPGYFWLAGGRRWHFFFAWIFALNGLLYVIYNIANGHMRKFLLTPKEAARVPAMVLYYFRIRKESPQESEYNPLQKMAYTGVFLHPDSAHHALGNGHVAAAQYSVPLAAGDVRRTSISAQHSFHPHISFRWFYLRSCFHGVDDRRPQQYALDRYRLV